MDEARCKRYGITMTQAMFSCSWVRAVFLTVCLTGSLSAAPATRPAAEAPVPKGTFKGWGQGDANPRTPGYHKMVYQWQEGGKQRELPFVIYLPEAYRPGTRQWPMLTFLSGVGERGSDPSAVMNVGIPVDVGNNPDLQKWLPMIILLPLCPQDRTWESPDMAPAVVRLIQAVTATCPVDRSRLYLTGLSMGGKGCWAVAREAPTLFSVVAPIVAKKVDPAGTAKILRDSKTTFLVISGQDDGASEPDSAHMVDALKKESIDVAYSMVPHGGHFIWPAYYGSREFYDWLLLHRRGTPPPKNRPTGDHMTGLYFAEAKGDQVAQQNLQAQLSRFLPYWFIDNCSAKMEPGFRPAVQGRKNIFVTYPLTADVACRLQTTMKLPKGKPAHLKLVIGRHPEGEWDLLVRVNESEVQRLPVTAETAPTGWLTADVDISSFVGDETRIQLVHQARGSRNASGYWAQVRVVGGN